MTIVFDYQAFFMQRYGGISRYFIELARHLHSESGMLADTHIVAPLHNNAYLAEAHGHFRKYGQLRPNIPKTRRIARCVNQVRSPQIIGRIGPDVIHETYYSPRMLGSTRAKRVVTVHDMIDELMPEHFSAHNVIPEYKKLAIERADHVICVSGNTQKDLLEIQGIDPSKTSVVHHGFTLTERPHSANASDQSPGRRPYILHVGFRTGYKNFHAVAAAYASSAVLSQDFDIVCFGGPALTHEERKSFERLRIPADRIQYVAGDDALLAQYYTNASLFVYPSLYEGFGIPPLEAMNYGCPVACSHTSSMPEVVGEAAMLFDPYSVDSMREAMETALFDTTVRDDLVRKGFERIRHFSWEKCARETFSVYQGFLM